MSQDYKWATVLSYHMEFHWHHHQEMTNSDYSNWGHTNPELQAKFLVGRTHSCSSKKLQTFTKTGANACWLVSQRRSVTSFNPGLGVVLVWWPPPQMHHLWWLGSWVLVIHLPQLHPIKAQWGKLTPSHLIPCLPIPMGCFNWFFTLSCLYFITPEPTHTYHSVITEGTVVIATAKKL